MSFLLQYVVPVLALAAGCAGWVLLQTWITGRDPDLAGIERGCDGGCGGGGCGGKRCSD